jgi:hypothetical protein
MYKTSKIVELYLWDGFYDDNRNRPQTRKENRFNADSQKEIIDGQWMIRWLTWHGSIVDVWHHSPLFLLITSLIKIFFIVTNQINRKKIGGHRFVRLVSTRILTIILLINSKNSKVIPCIHLSSQVLCVRVTHYTDWAIKQTI